jgi:hypothetical protein
MDRLIEKLRLQNPIDSGRKRAMAEPVKVEGAAPKKVYIHYEEGDEALHVTLKMTLPSKWAGHQVDYLKAFFVDHYNKKKPDHALDAASFHLAKKSGAALFGDDLLHTAVEKYEDIFLKPGASTPRPPKPDGELRLVYDGRGGIVLDSVCLCVFIQPMRMPAPLQPL